MLKMMRRLARKWADSKSCRLLTFTAALLALLVPLGFVCRIGVKEICTNQANPWADVWCVVVQFDLGFVGLFVVLYLLNWMRHDR